MDAHEPDLAAPRRIRAGAFALVALLHVLAVLALIRAFAPQFAEQAVKQVVATFTVTVTTPPPAPAPEPARDVAAGTAGEAGRKAIARSVNAPAPKVQIAKAPAPLAASTGDANASGAKAAGAGTGAGETGAGPGSGGSGMGQGGGWSRKIEKVSGAIGEADYPKATRGLRRGKFVIVVLNVSAAGRPTSCRVQVASPDPQADAITCRLALERFRFRPATDVQGNPVASVYGWKQWWYY